jgi:hypothetical protein
VNSTVGDERIICGGGYPSLVDYSLDTLPASATKLAYTDSTRGFRVVLEP